METSNLAQEQIVTQEASVLENVRSLKEDDQSYLLEEG